MSDVILVSTCKQTMTVRTHSTMHLLIRTLYVSDFTNLVKQDLFTRKLMPLSNV